MNRRSACRVFAGLLAGSLLALVPALDADAHVTVSSPDAVSGGFGKVVFRVPNESDSANTTAITVTLPSDPPFTFVSVGAVPGWTASTTTVTFSDPVEVDGFPVTEAVSTVTWTADGDGLPPEQFAEFQLSVGPFASEVDEFVFPAAQTYSDGEVVNWADPTLDGDDEPQHPAPVLDLADTGGSGEQSSDGGSDNVARALAIVGVALGAGGLALGWSARRSRRGEVR